jgi:hypothetical protein
LTLTLRTGAFRTLGLNRTRHKEHRTSEL